MPKISLEQLEKLIINGYTLVTANTAVDIKVFQQNYDWAEMMLNANRLVVEFWLTLDKMTAKPFYWSSLGVETPASNSFKEAVQYLENRDEIEDLADLIDYYGLPRGKWEEGPWSPPAPITDEDASILGVSPTATRTEILAAAKALGTPEGWAAYSRYNAGYCKGLATQHMCDFILNADGTLTVVNA